MTTRIIFNGQEYPSTEAMPENVRSAYLKALELFKDADANGIPDVLEGVSANTVIRVQESSITFKGSGLEGEERPGDDAPEGLDTVQSTLGAFLAFVAGFVLIFGVGLMFAIGGGREHLAGRLTVAIPALLLLGWLDTHATRLAKRRQPVLRPYTAGYRRFAVWSASGLLLAAALLLGLAWFLP
jgi:hypothetical protein